MNGCVFFCFLTFLLFFILKGLPEVVSQLVDESVDSGFQTASSNFHSGGTFTTEPQQTTSDFNDDLTDDDILFEMKRIESQQV